MALTAAFDAPALFEAYVQRMTEYSLTRVRAAGQAPPSTQDRQLALHTLNYALASPDAWPATRKLLIVLAPKMEQAGHRQDWLAVLYEGVRMSQIVGDQATEAELRLQAGIMHQLLADFERALEQYDRSVSGFATLRDKRGLARALNRRAYVRRRQGALAPAEIDVTLALALLDEEDIERGYSFSVLGFIAFDRQQWAEAVEHFRHSLLALAHGKQLRLLAWSYTNLGLALLQSQDLLAAEANLLRAIALFDAIHDPIHQAVARMNLGNVYVAQARYEEALSQFHAAEPVFRKAEDCVRQAKLLGNIGVAQSEIGRHAQAEVAYYRSSEIWRRLEDPARLANILEGLGKTYLERQRYDRAADVFRELLALLPNIDRPMPGATQTAAQYRTEIEALMRQAQARHDAAVA